jgi:hypothetical protein
VATTLDQLGQARPADTDTAVLFSTAAGETKIILGLTVANVSGAEAEFRIFIDKGGSGETEDEAIHWNVPVGAKSTEIDQTKRVVPPSSTVKVRSSVGDALNFTADGAIQT